MKSPFKFLDAFELKDKDAFFGRAEEIDALYGMVLKTPLLLVYGLSGTGKTSLLQCGLASRFTGPNWFPFPIRRGDDLNAAIRKALLPAMPPGEPLRDSLRDNVSLLFRYHLRPVYLLFDQFEELFILGDREEQLEFARSIRELMDAELPCKVILVMREEFIGQLYHLEKEIPTIYDFRLRVEPMGFKKVQEVIAGSFQRFHVELEDPADNLERIYQNISAGKSGVQLPYLQVYLDMLWREAFARSYDPAQQADWGRRMEGHPPVYPPLSLKTAEIASFGAIEGVLARFLLAQESELQADLDRDYPGAPAHAVRAVLDAFVTEEGTKRPVGFTRAGEAFVLEGRVAEKMPPLPPGALDLVLDRLAAARLLRERDGALELAHDALAALIDQERSDEQRRINEVHNRLRHAQHEHLLSEGRDYPSKKLLLDAQEILPRLPLTPELRDFYDKSQAALQQQADAERERVERELRLAEEKLRAEKQAREREVQLADAKLAAEKQAREQEVQLADEKLAAEQRARAKQRQFTRVVAVVAVLALAGLGLAVWQYFQAETAKATAENSEKIAKEQARIAVKSDSLMRLARDTAEQKAIETLLANTNTEKALNELKITSDQAVTILLEEIDQNILRLEYDLTFEKCQTALNLKAQHSAVEKRVLEIAYFYTEADTLAAAIRTLNLLKPTRLGEKTPGARGKLRHLIKAASPPAWYAVFEDRYYPKMIRVEGGSFLREDDSVRVKVSAFQIAETETTFWQYAVFAKAKHHYILPPSWQYAGDNPVVNVSWYDAALYANWLGARFQRKPVYNLVKIKENRYNVDLIDNIVGGYRVDSIDYTVGGYRLPIEAEWEFAARGGNQSKGFEYSGDSILTNVGWYEDNSNSRTQTVRQKKANELGLYDMSGNVWEWCNDWYNLGYDPKITENPRGPGEGSDRVLRGGGWDYAPRHCRGASRHGWRPEFRNPGIGFRLCLAPQ